MLRRLLLLLAIAPASAHAGEPGSLAGDGRLWIDLSLEVGLDADNRGDPVSLSPDLRYGISEALDVGLIHSTRAVTGFAGFQSGASFCVDGDRLCETLGLYHSAGVEGRYAVARGPALSLAATGALLANELDPFRLAVKLGATSRTVAGPIALVVDPNVQIAATERETSLDVAGIPVLVAVRAGALRLGIQSGIFSSLDSDVAKSYRVPLTAELALAGDRLGAGASFTFPALLGGTAVARTGFDARTLSVWVSVELGR